MTQLKSKEWNFFEVNMDIKTITESYHLLISNKNKQMLNLYWNIQIKLQNDERDDTLVPGFKFSYKKDNLTKIDDLISKNFIIKYIEQKFPDKQINASAYKLIFIISVFSNEDADMDVDFVIVDETTYKIMREFDLFSLPSWVFYLMIALSLLFFISIVLLVIALLKRQQEEQDLRILGFRKPLQQLSAEVVDTYIPKYTFKHIFKAIKKRRLEVLEEYSTIISKDENEQDKQNIIEQDEIRRKVQERCENILSNGECGICLCDFEFEDECRLTICEHIFHVGCFDPWLYKNQNCPYCRTTMNEETMKEWKQKNQQYYPLDESLGSVLTLDSKNVSKDSLDNTEKENPNPEQKTDNEALGGNISLGLVKKQSSQNEKSNPTQAKPIYFHSLSLQSLQDKSISPTIFPNNKRKSQKFNKLFMNEILIEEENHHKKQKTLSNLDSIYLQKDKQNAIRKKDRASTYVHSNIKQNKKITSANFLSKNISEQNIEEFITQNTESNYFDAKDHEYLKTNYQDCIETEATTRTRQDLQTLSVVQEVPSHHKLFQGHDSSAKLIKNSETQSNKNQSDSLNDSINGYKYNEKPKKASKFQQLKTNSKQKLDTSYNEEIKIEKSNMNQEEQV